MTFDTSTWYFISFVIFVGLIFQPAKTLLGKALSAKAEEINQKLIEAQALKEEAQALLAEAEEAKAESTRTARQIMEHATAELLKTQNRMEAEVAALADKQAALLTQRTAELQAKAKDEIYNHIVDTSMQTAQSLIQKTFTEDKQGQYTRHELKRIKHVQS